MVTTAIVLAGGLGTRLRSAVPDVPKPMAPIAGRPFLEYQLDYWLGQGVSHFILSVGYSAEIIMAHFGNRYRDAQIDYAVERTPLGTGGGLLLAARRIEGDAPFLLLNGDTFFEVSLDALRAFHAEHRSDWTFSLFRADEAGRYMGLDVGADGSISSMRGSKGEIGALANGGVYLIDPARLAKAGFMAGDKVSLENELLPAFQGAGGALYGMACAGKFIDIGVPADYQRAAAFLH